MSEYNDEDRNDSDLQDYEIEINEPPVDKFVPDVPLVERMMAWIYKKDQKKLSDGINTGAKDKKPKMTGSMSAGMALRSIRATIVNGIANISKAITNPKPAAPRETIAPTPIAKFDQEKALENAKEVFKEQQTEQVIEGVQMDHIVPKGIDVTRSSTSPNPATNLTSKISDAVEKYNQVAAKAEKLNPTEKVAADGATVDQKTIVDANGNTYGRVVPGPLGNVKTAEARAAEAKPAEEKPTVETKPAVEAKPQIAAEKISVNKDGPAIAQDVKIIKPDDVGKVAPKKEEKKTTIVNPILGTIEKEERDD